MRELGVRVNYEADRGRAAHGWSCVSTIFWIVTASSSYSTPFSPFTVTGVPVRRRKLTRPISSIFQIVPPHLAVFAAIAARRYRSASGVIEAIEAEIVVLPILSGIAMKRLKAYALRSILVQNLYFRLCSHQLLRFNPHRDSVLAFRLQLDCLHDSRVLGGILAEALHAKRCGSGVLHVVIRECCYALVILKAPPVR